MGRNSFRLDASVTAPEPHTRSGRRMRVIHEGVGRVVSRARCCFPRVERQRRPRSRFAPEATLEQPHLQWG